MTRIDDLSLTRVRLRFREPVRYGQHMLTSQEVGILRIMTDDGLTGLGEMSGPVLPAILEEAIERARRELVGRDPADIEPLPTGSWRQPSPPRRSMCSGRHEACPSPISLAVWQRERGGQRAAGGRCRLARHRCHEALAFIAAGSRTIKSELADGSIGSVGVPAGHPRGRRPPCPAATYGLEPASLRLDWLWTLGRSSWSTWSSRSRRPWAWAPWPASVGPSPCPSPRMIRRPRIYYGLARRWCL